MTQAFGAHGAHGVRFLPAPLPTSVFFKTVLHQGSNSKVITQLATVLLERTILLYDLEPFTSEARQVIAEQLLVLFQLQPQLVVDQQRELLDYLGNLRTLSTGGEHCYMHLVRRGWGQIRWVWFGCFDNLLFIL